MKSRICFCICTAVLCCFISCKKEVTDNNGLYGKWKLVELYDGYTSGGHFSWNNVENNNSHTIEFTADGNYIKQENKNSDYRSCFGNYQLINDSILNITSSCNTAIEIATITGLSDNELIIDYSVIEGEIRYKYEAIK